MKMLVFRLDSNLCGLEILGLRLLEEKRKPFSLHTQIARCSDDKQKNVSINTNYNHIYVINLYQFNPYSIIIIKIICNI